MGQFATGLATKSRLKSQLRFRERGQSFGKLKRNDTGKYDKKKKRMESESDDRRHNAKEMNRNSNISQKKGERR